MGKPVITATQMMESMIKAPVPTRAEVTDVAMAIVQGTDAVMLSAETSVGRYPIRAVEMMAEVACEAEKGFAYEAVLQSAAARLGAATDEAIAYSAARTAARLDAAVILAFTEFGTTAVRVSKCKPRTPILALTSNERTLRRLSLNWGVTAVRSPHLRRLVDISARGKRQPSRPDSPAPGTWRCWSRAFPRGRRGTPTSCGSCGSRTEVSSLPSPPASTSFFDCLRLFDCLCACFFFSRRRLSVVYPSLPVVSRRGCVA